MTERASPSPRFLTLLLLLASGAVVGTALLFEYAGGLAPCELCLYERWPYYATVVLAGLGLASGSRGAMKGFIGLAAIIFLAGAGLSFYHVGVEQHWFQGPTACTGGGGGAATLEALKAQLLNRQPVSCDEPAWKLFGTISLAGLNFLASLLLALFCIAGLRRLLAEPHGAAA